jgi:hypothetical protein
MVKTHQTSRPTHFQWAPWPQNALKCHKAAVSGGCSITWVGEMADPIRDHKTRVRWWVFYALLNECQWISMNPML